MSSNDSSAALPPRHFHLDPLGGVAGDMFCAAVLDAHPELIEPLAAAMQPVALEIGIQIELRPHSDHSLAGHRFDVKRTAAPTRSAAKAAGLLRRASSKAGHTHKAWREIRQWLGKVPLDAAVRERAIAIFAELAAAEAKVHGVDVDHVEFHEVGAWDSIADIVSAAWLVEELGPASWSVSPIPLGSGQVDTDHGRIPVPGPATAILLEGLPVHDDGIAGERVTPTGAAILRHLGCRSGMGPGALALTASGTGFGTRSLGTISNALRLLEFRREQGFAEVEQVATLEFEVDDQTPEDLAVALQRIGSAPGVLDVRQTPSFGKKGRMGAAIHLVVEAAHVQEVAKLCFEETTTLGVRQQNVWRHVIGRRERAIEHADIEIRVKRAERPNGPTAKAAMDDIAAVGARRAREAMRAHMEREALKQSWPENKQGTHDD